MTETPKKSTISLVELNYIDDKKGIPVFFKVRESVKKFEFTGSTLQDLQKLFIDSFFDTMNHKEFEEFPPFYVIDKESKISYEVERIEDIYSNCVLEVKMPKLESIQKKAGVGYYAFQKQKLVFVMVGLPARGKSYIARKIARYLRWVGVSTQVFNVGAYRRERLGNHHTAEFFDPSNTQGMRARLHMSIAALDDMLNWLNKGGRVAIYDATNTTRDRRQMILKRCNQEHVQTVFIESVCKDPVLIEKNIRDTKVSSQDYNNVDPSDAVEDFRKRIVQYEKAYQTLDESDKDLSYVKLIDVGRQIIINRIEAYLPSRVIHFLMNLHISNRPVWLTRHGESEFDIQNRIGGDSSLTLKGEEYAHALADWVEANISETDQLYVWTSTQKRCIGTAQYINHPKVVLKALDDIDSGICNGMTYDQIAETMPDEYAARAANKLKYKYPQGESYTDVMQRLEPVLFELERQKVPVLIVCHQAVLRALFAYFLDIESEEVPFVNVESNTVYQFISRAHGTEVKTSKLLE